jgi:hypothetical protein
VSLKKYNNAVLNDTLQHEDNLEESGTNAMRMYISQ